MIKKTDLENFDWYIAITRGGLITTQLLSYISGIKKIDTICVTSYEGENQKDIKITSKNYSHLRGQRVLLIDELVESGNTMQSAVNYLKKFSPSEIKTLVLFKKVGGNFQPDYFLETRPNDRWIVFKYDELKIENIIEYVEKN